MSESKIKIKLSKVNVDDLDEEQCLNYRDELSNDLQKLNKAKSKAGSQMNLVNNRLRYLKALRKSVA